MERVLIKRVKHVRQGENSANCGPCGLKMIADYYGIRHPKTRGPISVHSFNRFLKTSSEWGTEPQDLHRLAKRLGLRPKRIAPGQLKRTLKKGHPVLSLFIDESGIGHYAPIIGMEKTHLIFHDSYWGRKFKRSVQNFKKMASPFRQWMYAYLPENQ